MMQMRRRTRATTMMIEVTGLLCSSHRHFHILVFAQQQTLLQYSHRSQDPRRVGHHVACTIYQSSDTPFGIANNMQHSVSQYDAIPRKEVML